MAFNNYGALDSFDMIQAQSEKFSPEVKKIIDTVVSTPEIANFIKIAKVVYIAPLIFRNHSYTTHICLVNMLYIGRGYVKSPKDNSWFLQASIR